MAHTNKYTAYVKIWITIKSPNSMIICAYIASMSKITPALIQRSKRPEEFKSRHKNGKDFWKDWKTSVL